MLHKQEITAGIRALGIKPGDTLMAHSSLKSFGEVDGGVDAVIDGILDAVGPNGHVLMPALSATYTSNQGGLYFHRAKTPSRVGYLTEAFRARPGTARSEHPTHSLSCRGPRAAELTSQHHWKDGSTFHLDSPYAKMVQAGAKIAFFGVIPSCNTTYHAIEDWLEWPYSSVSWARLEEDDGTKKTVKVTRAPLGPRGFYSRNDRIHPRMEAEGAITKGVIGPCAAQVLDAQMMVRLCLKWELAEPGLFLHAEGTPDRFSNYWRPILKGMKSATLEKARLILARGLGGKGTTVDKLTGS
ncbi:MAG TPA: AAC(3) family N-acetyltransferase [Planctomycetota bacterium]|jgi:aminoglycoside 3-N-acetyltransferase|nr:AAC(3) family N-acetyltransferase [Planctomycetota bacterium]